MTYEELRAAIQDYCEYDNPTFVANIPSFIRRAEQRIYYWTQHPLFRQSVTGQTMVGNRFLSLPNDFRAPLSFRVGDTYLLNKDVNFIREAFPDETAQGMPRYYALFDESCFLLGPTPDMAYATELNYSFEPSSLTVGADTGETWLSINAQDALLYASLVQAYTFMKGESTLLQHYETLFNTAMRRLKVFGEGRNRKDVYRGGELRVPVN